MGMVTGNKCRGSGYSEILIEAELVTTGCLSSVLKGKAYAKALFCLKTVSEAMQRLLFERFAEEENVEVHNPVALLNLVQTCNRQNLDLALQDPSTLTILERYASYENQVRNGHLGKTATFWLSVIEHTRLILIVAVFCEDQQTCPFSTSVTGKWLTSFLHMMGQTTQGNLHFRLKLLKNSN